MNPTKESKDADIELREAKEIILEALVRIPKSKSNDVFCQEARDWYFLRKEWTYGKKPK